MAQPTQLRTRTVCGLCLLVGALPISAGAFWVGAWAVCEADNCYGDNAGFPLIVLLVVLIAAVSLGTLLFTSGVVDGGGRRRRQTALGRVLVGGAIPAAVAAYAVVAARYGRLGFSGDYLLLWFAAAAAAAGTALFVIVTGVRTVRAGRGDDN